MLRIKSTIYLTGQTIPKSQIQMTKTIARFDIVIWNLFGICLLSLWGYLWPNGYAPRPLY
jgi:glutathionyl-hydroquinone reductase